MPIVRDVLVRIRSVFEGTGARTANAKMLELKQRLVDTGIGSIQAGNAMKRLGVYVGRNKVLYAENERGVRGMGDVMKATRRASLRPFRGEFLSLMFLGQGVAAMFGGMMNTVLKLTGVFDVWRATLISVLGPVLIPLSQILIKLMTWFMKLPSPVKKAIGVFVVLGFAIGKLLAVIAPLLLLMSVLGYTIPSVGTAAATLGTAVRGLVVGPFSILGKALIWLVPGLGKLTTAFSISAGTVGFAATGIGTSIALIVKNFDDFVNGLKRIGQAILHPFRAIKAFFAELGKMGGAWEATKAFFSPIAELFGAERYVPKGYKTAALQRGGIVTRPTLATLGERGPEAVVPLRGGGGMAGNEVMINYNPTFNVSASGGADVDRIVATVNERLYADLRRLGIR